MASSAPRWLPDKGSQPGSIFASKHFYLPTVIIVALILVLRPWNLTDRRPPNPSAHQPGTSAYGDDHIIHDLVTDADNHFNALRESETFTIGNAAAQYRERRGRHPPPGFEAWYSLARKSSTVMIEAFYDQIYEDLEPFWGVDPQELRAFALQWPTTMSIRNGTPDLPFPHILLDAWFGVWQKMALLMPGLPDVDIALLAGDQPAVMASFDKVSAAMNSAKERLRAHQSLPIDEIVQEYPTRQALTDPLPTEWPQEGLVKYPEHSDRFWDYVAAACKPTDPVVTSPEAVPNASLPLVFSESYTVGTKSGFVSNVTQSRSVCQNPNLRTLHGFMIRPGVPRFYTELRPIFVFGKIAGVNNDIVIPAPANYLEQIYSGVEQMQPWEKKQNKLFWRGSGTGGDWRPDTWFGFQRHRFVRMLNSTVVRNAQADMADLAAKGLPQTYQSLIDDAELHNMTFDPKEHHIQLPLPSLFKHTLSGLADWLEKSTSVAFTHFFCWPFRSLGPPGDCPYILPYFKIADHVSIGQVLMNKYLPDIDGQSISARFRGFLQSTSVPIKATIFTEWHNSRLTAWRDFIPLSNEFQELYELIYFFIGDGSASPHRERHAKRSDSWFSGKGKVNQRHPDLIAERIGQQGSEWTRRVMRKEDMVLYFHRLILEYARVTSDNRVELGWVEDLLPRDNLVPR